MNWYIHVLKNYVYFAGRARRKEYWHFVLFYVSSLVLATAIDMFTGTYSDEIGFGWASGAYFVATLLPMLGVSVRRLHDIGRSGWWALLGLVPMIGGAILLVLAIFNGQPGPNAYGVDPKAPEKAMRTTSEPGHSANWNGPPGNKAVRAWVLFAMVTAVAAGAGWLWQRQHQVEFSHALLQGSMSGERLDEPGCLVTALERVRASRDSGLVASVVEGAWLGSCLKSSRVVTSFCDGVPTSSEVIAAAGWIASECSRRGLVGQTCTVLLQQVTAHCTAARRVADEHI